MKKIYQTLILTVLLFISSSSMAVVHSVVVSNFQFTPASLSVNVGDTIVWTLGSGNHTTTSNTIPVGADPWDSPINSSVQSFTYIITVAGTYDYICTPHVFAGQIVAINTGINSLDLFSNFNIFSVRPSIYNISYSLARSGNIKISVYDITGKSAKILKSSYQTAGTYTSNYNFEDLKKGIYIFEMIIDKHRFTKRLVID